jgi:hypothetical protein
VVIVACVVLVAPMVVGGPLRLAAFIGVPDRLRDVCVDGRGEPAVQPLANHGGVGFGGFDAEQRRRKLNTEDSITGDWNDGPGWLVELP